MLMLMLRTTTPRSPSRLVLAIAAGQLTVGCQTEAALSALSGPPGIDSDSDSSTGGGSGEASSITLTAVTSDTGDGQTDPSTTGSNTDDTVNDTDGTTDGSNETPPEILEASLSPATITANGPIIVQVSADSSDGVRMVLENGDVVELAETAPGLFASDIAVLTGFDNGSHDITLQPWRNIILGEEVDLDYVVALPEPGTELLWEAADHPPIGAGWVVAMSELPDGDVVELGTRIDDDDDDKRRCYLRRRTPEGDWTSQDIEHLLPNEECQALDLVIREDGTLHTLLSRKIGPNAWTWWLSEITTWGSTPITVDWGPLGDEAKALAYRDGALAVCGTTPSGLGDLDAFVRVFRPGEPVQLETFDSEVPGKVHWFDETPQDCTFAAEERLVLVGDAYGPHENDPALFMRRFVMSVQLDEEDAPVVTVGPKEALSHSYATTVDTDSLGTAYVVGYACDKPCTEVAGRLWTYDDEGIEVAQHAIGNFDEAILAPHALQWSPAGYLVVASGDPGAEADSFVVQAFAPGQYDSPLWTYVREDPFKTHIPLVAFVGRYAQLYLGGLGANLYPAVLFVGS